MTSVDSRTIEVNNGAKDSVSSWIGTDGWLRLAVGVAAILAIVAGSALDKGASVDRSGLQTNEQPVSPEAWPAYDGRGKWSGY